jgi:DNA-binding PadR family transcriptional regulator
LTAVLQSAQNAYTHFTYKWRNVVSYLFADGGPPLRTTDLLVLAVLGDGPQHGYAIAREIAARTRGRVTVRAGDLYRVLYRMDNAKLIETAPQAGHDERRATYRITALGRRVARTQAAMLGEICAAVLARHAVGASS